MSQTRLFDPDAIRKWWDCPWCECLNRIPGSHVGWGLYPARCVACHHVVMVWPNQPKIGPPTESEGKP